MILGADFSNYQGTLSPQMVQCFKDRGIAHVVIRASLEDAVKRQLARQQLQALKDGGIGISVYLWCYHSMDPAQQAQQALDWYGDLTPSIWWLDAEEVDPRWDGDGPAQRVAWLQTCLQTLEQAGQRAGIYTGAWWWKPFTADSTAFAGYPLWVAEYDNRPDLDVFYPFGGWSACQGKQYTGNGELCGLRPIDLDAFDAALFDAPEAPVEEDDPVVMQELQRIAQDEVIRNIELALATKRLPKAAREALQWGALPAAQTIARGGAPEE